MTQSHSNRREGRKSACLTEVSVFYKYPEILQEVSMHKQCVPGSFFSAHAREARFTGVGLAQDCTKLEISSTFPLGFPFPLYSTGVVLMNCWCATYNLRCNLTHVWVDGYNCKWHPSRSNQKGDNCQPQFSVGSTRHSMIYMQIGCFNCSESLFLGWQDTKNASPQSTFDMVNFLMNPWQSKHGVCNNDNNNAPQFCKWKQFIVMETN